MWTLWAQLGQDRGHLLPDRLDVPGSPQNKGLCISCPSASKSVALLSWAGSTHPSDIGSAVPSPL